MLGAFHHHSVSFYKMASLTDPSVHPLATQKIQRASCFCKTPSMLRCTHPHPAPRDLNLGLIINQQAPYQLTNLLSSELDFYELLFKLCGFMRFCTII